MTAPSKLRVELEDELKRLAVEPLPDGLPTYSLDAWQLPCGWSGVARWLKDRDRNAWAHVNVQGAANPDALGRALVAGVRALSGGGAA